LPQAARATAATREANRSDFFILILNERFRQLPVIVGTLRSIDTRQIPNGLRPTKARAFRRSSP
jgi:hypothetical protein